MSKITLATVKSFIRKANTLYIKNISHFSGMTDSVEQFENPKFKAVEFTMAKKGYYQDNQLGIFGAWFVFGGRDQFTKYDDSEYIGYEIYNCCGSFLLVTPKHYIFHPANVTTINNGDSMLGTTVIVDSIPFKYII